MSIDYYAIALCTINRWTIKAYYGKHFGVDVPAVIEVESEAKEAVRTLLPELPDYIERAVSKLSDDKDFGGITFTSEMKATICRIYAQTGSVDRVCEKAKISAPCLYKHLEIDPDFRSAFSLSKMSLGDRIQTMSIKRALDPMGVVDRMCQLKRFFPRVYRESPTQIAVGVSLQFNPHPSADT